MLNAGSECWSAVNMDSLTRMRRCPQRILPVGINAQPAAFVHLLNAGSRNPQLLCQQAIDTNDAGIGRLDCDDPRCAEGIIVEPGCGGLNGYFERRVHLRIGP